jgi:hypothetical protein
MWECPDAEVRVEGAMYRIFNSERDDQGLGGR